MSEQNDNFKPMLCCDWYEEKIKFPCIVQVKIDGVHSLNRFGKCVGRSLKPHDNRFITELFSKSEYHGFCGEKINADLGETHPDLCRITSGDLRRYEGQPNIKWILFDYCTEETKHLGYTERMQDLERYFYRLPYELRENIEIIESNIIHNLDQLLEFETDVLDVGYEGIIIRDPNAPYKYGRCGKTFMGAWRVKRFIDAEFLIEAIEEGRHNANEATKNELGRTERSTHQENMHPNGLVGALTGALLADIIDPQSKKVLVKQGEKVRVAPGSMTHDERKFYFENQDKILGKIGKMKLFPKGIKDMPRFPQFTSIRNENDL